MATAEMVDPDENGNCPEGYEKRDGKCHMKESPMSVATDVPVREGEIVVKLSQLEELKIKAAKAERLTSLEEKLRDTEARAEELAVKQREDRIEYKLRGLKIPAFRAFARAFYDMALAMPVTRTYTLTDAKLPMLPEAVVDQWVTSMNAQAAVLFSTLSIDVKTHDPSEPDELGPRIEYRVKAYAREHKLMLPKDYKLALTAVLEADPGLKEAYHQS